jgi:hypothetical protein
LGEGRILAQGDIPTLQAQLALGDRVILIFAGQPPEMDFKALPGVLEARLQAPELELVVDHRDSRLPAHIREITAAGGNLTQIKVRGVDLEDLYREYSH